MTPFPRRSIKAKLIVMSMAAAAFALLLAGAAVLTFELRAMKSTAESQLTTVANMLAGAGSAALVFEDTVTAGELLGLLSGEPDVVSGALYTNSGRLLASYRRQQGGEKPPQRLIAAGVRFEDSGLVLVYPVTVKNERAGSIYLKSDLAAPYARLQRYMLILLLVLLLSLAGAAAVTARLQRAISLPVQSLAETARQVSEGKNYLLRARRMGDDELGYLVERFNEMMQQVYERDLALRAAQNELEDRVKQRTRELLAEITERKNIERDLITARDQAEQSNRSKSTFLANMSHELRTPLNAIIGYSEMLIEDAEAGGDATASGDLKRIRSAGRHLLALINDILDISKIEAGKMDLRCEEFSVSEVIEHAASTVEPLARERGNRLEVRCGQPGSTMYTDPLKFRQSLLNLLANACKFTRDGTITLEVSQRMRAGQEFFDWAVSDTGIGIAPDQMDKLFQSFSQVDGSSTRRFGGTGLGLAISQKLCRMMGGEIKVASRLGEGSTFTMSVPARMPEGADGDVRRAVRPSGILNGNLVLVIDDEPALHDLAYRALTRAQWQVRSAFSGGDGLKAMREARPAAVLLDLRLPDRSGESVLEEMRLDAALHDVPVIVVTVDDAAAAPAVAAANAWLRKPVSGEEILEALAALNGSGKVSGGVT